MKGHEPIQQEMLVTAGKGTVGFAGSFAAMSINDIAGLIVAVLTGIYLFLQIQDILRKRKKEKEQD